MQKWTDAQASAIYAPSCGGNILVSAAAGSGKTAVLVERIVNMIMRGENPVSIDELLVVTFTEAAAAEMKERIINRINQAYRDAVNEGDTETALRLREQIRLTLSADINTIDSFCLGVVKNNFHVLGIDPNFSIMDENEGKLIMDDTLTELFLSLYADEGENKERFIRLIKQYASNRDDEGLKSVILKIYRFIQSMPEPLAWLYEKADMYSADMTESKWLCDVVMRYKKDAIIKRCEDEWNELLTKMLEKVEEEYGISFDTEEYESIAECEKYWGRIWKNVCACKRAVDTLKKAQTWDDFYDFYKTYIEKKTYLGIAIKIMPAKKEAPDDVWQLYYNKYDAERTYLRNECMKLPSVPKDEFNKYVHAEEVKQSVDDIVWLTEKFAESFDEKKSKRNIKSFSDIEHLAYRLFKENENIRNEYAEKYTEILIDEFQDTNGLQEALFSSISRGGRNMFMVGDLKQSIYRFRGGDPTIFKDKSISYALDENENTRIMLSQNFRSRREVINSINALFDAVMDDAVGDVEYNDDEALKREEERECYEDGENLLHPANRRIGYNSELHRVAAFKDSGMSEEEAEAVFIADKIRDLIDSHYQVRGNDGKYRDIEYRDIVVLMRATKGSGEIVREALDTRNVPAFVQKEEYFERREIKLMLSLISLINNHMQDIPLLAVMRSPIGGFTENELAKIKLDYNGRSFYKAVKGYKIGEDNLTDEENLIRSKCRRFIENLDRWRGYVKLKPIASLIWTLYEETGFYDFMGALEGGEEAQANLKLLYERAKKYEESGFKGIFNFIRYIERMENRNEDISGAKTVNENHNVVRIMTIHKSKGLEFPVVFVARTTKNFVFKRAKDENRITLHKDLGIGVDYYNYEDMYVKKLMYNKYIDEENRREFISEEMRLLYVALTRAKEKLIVTSSHIYKTPEEHEAKINYWRENYFGQKLKKHANENAQSYSDWIIPAVESSGKCWEKFDDIVSESEYSGAEKKEEKPIKTENKAEVKALVEKILEFKYQYPESGKIPSKTSVTAIKEMEDGDRISEDNTVYMTQKPKFMREEKSGAEIGTAHHQVMAFINAEKLKNVPESEYEKVIKQEMARIADAGQLDKSIAEDEKLSNKVCANICGFFVSDMGKRVLSAKRVYREKPFEIEITAQEYDPSIPKGYDDEKIVVQGIIDLYFEDEDGNITLVDYKTDRCKTEEEQQAVAEKYRKQLELYETAMEKILKKSVKDKYLYLFSAQSVVKLK